MKTTLNILLFLFWISQIYAQQHPQPHFRNYNTDHGLPSSEVYCAFQDSKGYLWFGTDNGAARFDGYQFKTYGAKEGLKGNVVFEIHEDSQKRIWFGTMFGEVYLLDGDTILPYEYNGVIRKYKDQYAKSELKALDHDGNAYFELLNLGVLIIDQHGMDRLITPNDSAVHIVYHHQNLDDPIAASTLIRNEQIQLSFENSKKVYIHLVNQGQNYHFDLPFIKGKAKGIITSLKLVSGHFLIAYRGNLYCLKDGKTIWHIPFVFEPVEMRQDKEGKLWFCLNFGGGLHRYENLLALKNDQRQEFFPGYTISNMFWDKAGGIWITSTEEGVFYCGNTGIVKYDTKFGLSGDVVTAVTF